MKELDWAKVGGVPAWVEGRERTRAAAELRKRRELEAWKSVERLLRQANRPRPLDLPDAEPILELLPRRRKVR